MKITTVLLDAGGVILDESESELIKAEIISRTLKSVISGYSTDCYFADIEEAVESFCPDAYGFVLWKYSKGETDLFERLYADYRAEWSRRTADLRMSHGLEREIHALSEGYDLGIAGQYGSEILNLLESRSILSCFAHQYTQDDFSITKPDPRYFEQIASACGVEPQRCIMVGDRIDKDVIPAKQVGMKTVLVRVGLHRNQQARIPYELPDVELPSVVGLATAIEELTERG